jgi:hypothetical protein
MSSSPRPLFRRILKETGNPVAAIRAVREVFGLSLAEAKALWMESVGQTEELSDHQQELAAAQLRVICPRCLLPDRVIRKLHTLPSGLGLAHPEAPSTAPISERFVNGFWCSACEVAFIPEHLLGELGLEKYRAIQDRVRPQADE